MTGVVVNGEASFWRCQVRESLNLSGCIFLGQLRFGLISVKVLDLRNIVTSQPIEFDAFEMRAHPTLRVLVSTQHEADQLTRRYPSAPVVVA